MSTEGANSMSINPVDCSVIEESINNLNLYISTTRDQVNKLDPNAQDVEEQREALTRKLSALEEQLNDLQKALDDCQKGLVWASRAIDIAPKENTM
jgi:chromosome segregation ATPase